MYINIKYNFMFHALLFTVIDCMQEFTAYVLLSFGII